jgi:iron complex transport system substrate-binding protein
MRFSICLSIILLGACGVKQDHSAASQQGTAALELRYATGFRITKIEGAKLVEVLHPYQNSNTIIKYLLVKRGQPVPSHDEDVEVIRIPIQTIVCTSTTHIPLLDYLDASEKLIGFPTTDYISSTRIRERIDSGFVSNLGIEDAMNLERLVVLKPDLVMSYSVSGRQGQTKKINELGIPVVINAEYLETHPLGRAEWIKFMAAFLDKESQANEVFSIIENNYLAAKELVRSELNQPTVLSGIVYNDAWFLPGGQNYASRILKDAGYRYLWEGDSTIGFLRLSFEAVYEKAKDADYWIGVGSFNSLEDLKNADNRYALFKAFKDRNVYTYDVRKGEKGGSEFFELGYLRPDIILKDLIKIYRPELIKDHQLYFHRKLE